MIHSLAYLLVGRKCFLDLLVELGDISMQLEQLLHDMFVLLYGSCINRCLCLFSLEQEQSPHFNEPEALQCEGTVQRR